jgi:hypothetical protein
MSRYFNTIGYLSVIATFILVAAPVGYLLVSTNSGEEKKIDITYIMTWPNSPITSSHY